MLWVARHPWENGGSPPEQSAAFTDDTGQFGKHARHVSRGRESANAGIKGTGRRCRLYKPIRRPPCATTASARATRPCDRVVATEVPRNDASLPPISGTTSGTDLDKVDARETLGYLGR